MTTKLTRWQFARWTLALAIAGAGSAAQAEGLQRPLQWRLLTPPASAVPLAASPLLPKGCPQAKQEWIYWRESMIQFLLKLHKSGRLDRDEVSSRSTQIVAALDKCTTPSQPAPPSILGNLEAFVRAQHNANYQLPNPQHQFGHGPQLNDEQYLCKIKNAVELPCLLRSQEFLGHLRRQQDYGKAYELIQKQNRGESVANCLSDNKQWDTLFYRSRMLTTPDKAETFGRFLVVVPAREEDKGYDRWIQFGIWTPGPTGKLRKDQSIQNVSVVAVSRVPEPASGEPLPPGSFDPPGAFDAMADWFRCVGKECGPQARESDGATMAGQACMNVDPESTVQLKYRLAVSGQSEDCQRCHKHMPLGIHPKTVYVPTQRGHLKALPALAAASAVAAINGRFYKLESYKRPARFMVDAADKMVDWQNYGRFGFGFSPENFEYAPGKFLGIRDPGSLTACAAPDTLKPDELNRVMGAMKCDDCHHARQDQSANFGVLNYPLATDLSSITSVNKASKIAPNIIRSHIANRVMPLELDDQADDYSLKPSNLSDKERKVLYRCLSREYFDPNHRAGPSGLFVDWLRNEDVPSTLIAVVAKSHAPLQPMVALTTKPMLAAHAATPAAPAASVPLKSPESLYRTNCGKCHFPSAKGPKLTGIVGRIMAGDSQYGGYSAGLKLLGSKGEKWTDALLMDFLKDPNAFVNQNTGTSDGKEMAKPKVDEATLRLIVNHLPKL